MPSGLDFFFFLRKNCIPPAGLGKWSFYGRRSKWAVSSCWVVLFRGLKHSLCGISLSKFNESMSLIQASFLRHLVAFSAALCAGCLSVIPLCLLGKVTQCPSRSIQFSLHGFCDVWCGSCVIQGGKSIFLKLLTRVGQTSSAETFSRVRFVYNCRIGQSACPNLYVQLFAWLERLQTFNSCWPFCMSWNSFHSSVSV